MREAIGRRLNRLSGDCDQVLTVASVIGRTFELGQLSRLITERSEEDLLEALEEGLGASIIEEVPGSATGFQFSHALIQETLAGELSAARRVRLHAQIEQAHHFAEAEQVLGPDQVVRYSLLAGEQALAIYAFEEALVNFQRALDSKEGKPLDAETAALLFGLARAQAATLEKYRSSEVVFNLSRAFDYYADSGDMDHAMAASQFNIYGSVGVRTGIPQLVSRALGLVPPDSLEAGRRRRRQGEAMAREEGDYDGAQELFRRALANVSISRMVSCSRSAMDRAPATAS